MRRVIVRIDRLVLSGFRREDRYLIAAAMQAELSRRLREPGGVEPWVSRGDVARLSVTAVRVDPASGPAGVGSASARGIARAVRS
jgi:hypothetical protein